MNVEATPAPDDAAAVAALQRVADECLRASTWLHAELPDIELREQWRALIREREGRDRGNQQQT